MTIAGVVILIVGIILVEELFFKFLKFAIGLICILIAVPLILGGWGMYKHRVVKIHRH